MKWTCALCRRSDVPKKARRGICQPCYARLAPIGLDWCMRCQKRVPLTEMAPTRAWCRACERARYRAWLETNPGFIRAWQRAHPEKVKAFRHESYIRRKARAWRGWKKPYTAQTKGSDADNSM